MHTQKKKKLAMLSTSRAARLFICFIIMCGLSALSYGALQIHSLHHFWFLTVLAIALVASRLKLKLPGLNGTMSVNLPFILIAVVELGMFEALMIALASTVAQCSPKDRGRPKAVQTLFNVSTMAVAVCLAGRIFQSRIPAVSTAWLSGPLFLVLAGTTFFLVQTIPVATILSLTEGGSALRIWSSIFHLSFPYYVLSAGVTSLATAASHRIGWQIPLLVLPVMFGVYQSYGFYFGRGETLALPVAMAKAAGAE
jgi:hypothetical protein